jgi:release factor glutamine methyltransferase
MATTYNNLFLDTRARLRQAGIEAAQLEARELVCYAADKSREQLYRDMSLYASAELEKRVDDLVRRRLSGEPVAYIIGEWEFYGLSLDISQEVLIPRADTELLAERGIQRAREAGEGARVLDLCAGSGCVGLAIAANVPSCRVVLGELSEGALRTCKQNVRRNGLNARVTCLSVDALEPPSAALWDFDVIVCNPPYIPTGDIAGLDGSVKDYEPHMALDGGTDGLDFYRVIAPKWRPSLRLGGALLFEVGIGQAPDVEEILTQSGYENIQRGPPTAEDGQSPYYGTAGMRK